MTGSDRHVDRVHLRAASARDARRTSLALEDALRTASFRGERLDRLILVRTLRLGTLKAGLPPQSLALALERAYEQVVPVTVDAQSAAAAAAEAVCFESTLQAHTLLALRLLNGPPPREWFWRLAVPAWDPRAGCAEALAAIAMAVADRPEGTTALRHWLAALIRAGRGDSLSAALGPEQRRRLLQSLGGRQPRSAAEAIEAAGVLTALGAEEGSPAAPSAGSARARGGSGGPSGPGKEAARRSTTAAGIRKDKADPPNAAGVPQHLGAERGRAAAHDPTTPRSRATPPLPSETFPTPSTPPPVAARRSERRSRLRGSPPLLRPTSPHAVVLQSGLGVGKQPEGEAGRTGIQRAGAASPDPAPGPPEESRTAAGGLLFLLNALRHRGFPTWLEHRTSRLRQQRELTLALLGQTLVRLKVARSDPIWMAVFLEAGEERATAPSAWPRSRQRPWATTLLRRLRRQLRCRHGIGLEELVLRPGLLHSTATHLEVGFDLNQVDLRMRIGGLDLDPGWLPWLGRVVRFRYGQEVPG